MHFRRFIPTFFTVAALFLGLAATNAPAQQGDDLGLLVSNSLTHMKKSEWPQALQLLTRATERFGKNAHVLFGPKFGVVWYRKGFCELKLKRYADAMKSFEKCYEFKNKGSDVAGGGNPYNKKALLKWGDAALGAEDYAQAIRLYKKFLKERDPTRDNFPKGAFFINMSICYFKTGKIPSGIENLEIAIKNKTTFPTPDAGIVAGFQALVGAVIEKGDEQALLDFVKKNRADIIVEPFEMAPYSPLFMKLAADAIEAGMVRAATTLYQMVPSTDVVLDDIKVRLAQIGPRRGVADGPRRIVAKALKDEIAKIATLVSKGKETENTALAAMAYIHETEFENDRTAFAAYEQLELFHHKNKTKRESNLYNLVRTSSLIGEVFITEEYGHLFIKLFPDSKHIPSVRRMMLTSLFYEGEYKKCIEVASSMIDKLPKGSVEHDICLHVLGGSYYYEGRYEEAQPWLDKHVEEYPKSKFRQAALYFQASNLSRLQYWGKAAKLLDAFFKEFPEPGKNVFFPFALYDRANCHYAENEFDPALEKLNRLEKEFPTAEVIDMAYDLKGNVLQTQEHYDEAEVYYKKALELAERRGNRAVASEALYYLVAMLGEEKRGKEPNPRLKDAVPFADKFWKEYSDSPYKTQVAVAQMYALDAVGRGDEALDRLRDVIGEMASMGGNAVGLEEAINSYTEFYLKKHTPEELKKHYYNFPKVRASDKAALALLRIAVIGVFENVAKKAETPAAKTAANSQIKALFQELRRDFAPKDLTNYILVRLGDYLRTKTSSPRSALPYFDEALARENDQSYKFQALFGRADVLAGGTKEEMSKAQEDLKHVFEDSGDKSSREKALYRIIEIEMKKGDYAAARKDAKLYLSPTKDGGMGFRQHSPEVQLILARTYDKGGMVNDALAMYVKIWSAHMGYIRVSAPAMKRWMELMWDRNAPATEKNSTSDRQSAYEAGFTFIEATGKEDFYKKMDSKELDLWSEVKKLVEAYESTPGIKSMAQIRAERASGR